LYIQPPQEIYVPAQQEIYVPAQQEIFCPCQAEWPTQERTARQRYIFSFTMQKQEIQSPFSSCGNRPGSLHGVTPAQNGLTVRFREI